MGRVEKLERQRVERLAAELVAVLRECGEVRVETDVLENIERWRDAARRAGRILGWRVRTGVSRDGRYAWVVSEDWPVPRHSSSRERWPDPASSWGPRRERLSRGPS